MRVHRFTLRRRKQRASSHTEVYTQWAWSVPQPGRVRRAGARPGVLAKDLRTALRQEATRLSAITDPVARIKAVGDAFAALDTELERLALVRLQAVRDLRGLGWSYDRIAAGTGLSKGRVAQLCRDDRGR